MSADFQARYPGRCSVCDQAVRVGDRATFVEDQLAHHACPTPAPLAEPCGRCFIVPAINGSCGCDE